MSVLLALVLFYIAAYNMALLMQRAERAHGSIRNILEQIKLDDQQTISRYQALLNDIPEDSIILVMLDRPYLLDFTKHEIWLNDWPGASSLPPGLPFNKKDGEALSSYLLSKNIRYIAYSYEDQAVFRDRFKVWLVPPDEMPLWAVNEKHNYDFRDTIKRVYDFQDTVMSLSRKRLRVYDDSRIFILDLATVVSTKEEL
jgi:hypothetical protein